MSFFPRVGGKHFLKKVIVPLIPTHKVYVESFVGAGSIFRKKEQVELEVINDLDKDIYYIWKGMKKVQVEIINRYDFTPSRTKFEKFKKTKFKDPSMRLYRNLYLSFNSFAGNRNSFADHRNYDRPHSREHLKKNIEKIKDRLKNTTILNKDFRAVIKKYDSPDTFFYLDPPYDEGENKSWGYKHYVSPEDVYNALKGIKGKFILSYNYSKKLKHIFKGFKIRKVKTTYIINNASKKAVRELLISNF